MTAHPKHDSNILKCDIAIIGGGAGGLSVAAGAAQLGVKVMLIENHKMGGDCLNAGCVPSKSLLAIAKTCWQVRQSESFGVQYQASPTQFQAVMQHVKQVITRIGEHDSVARFEALGVQVILAPAQFIDKKMIQAGNYRIRAKRFVIATGSTATIPPIPGIDSIPYLTNKTIFDLTEPPKHLIIIGGGPIGAELAQAFAMLSVPVTLLEGLHILPKDEADCVAIVKEQLQATGVTLHEGINITAVAKSKAQIDVTYHRAAQSFTVSGSHLLVAAGRSANVQGLNLEKANIDYSAKGIVVDRRLRTTNHKVFAIGDVSGALQFTHVASYHASIVLKNSLFRLPAKVNNKAIPWVTYTEPELAHVGLLSDEAKQQGIHITVTQWPFTDNDRAQAERHIIGKIKIITDKKARILGVTIVGTAAGELILPWVMAIREGKTLRCFTDAIAPYPTLSEISKQVAGQFYTPLLFSNKMRRLVRWLMKLS